MTKPQLRRIIADETKEQQLLHLAQTQYQSYKDIAVFAEECGLKPGIVYHTLKYHNFIQQNETTEYRVLDAYYQCNGNLRGIVEMTGLGVWICAKTLENLGFSPKWQSYREIYQANSTPAGGWAEQEFKRLVPDAIDMNNHYRMNNPRFDFLFKDKEIDVKFSALRKTKGSNYQYSFRYKPDEMPDLFCFFIAAISTEELKSQTPDEYKILLIPSAALPPDRDALNINHDRNNKKALSRMYWDFEVAPAALESFLESL